LGDSPLALKSAVWTLARARRALQLGSDCMNLGKEGYALERSRAVAPSGTLPGPAPMWSATPQPWEAPPMKTFLPGGRGRKHSEVSVFRLSGAWAQGLALHALKGLQGSGRRTARDPNGEGSSSPRGAGLVALFAAQTAQGLPATSTAGGHARRPRHDKRGRSVGGPVSERRPHEAGPARSSPSEGGEAAA